MTNREILSDIISKLDKSNSYVSWSKIETQEESEKDLDIVSFCLAIPREVKEATVRYKDMDTGAPGKITFHKPPQFNWRRRTKEENKLIEDYRSRMKALEDSKE